MAGASGGAAASVSSPSRWREGGGLDGEAPLVSAHDSSGVVRASCGGRGTCTAERLSRAPPPPPVDSTAAATGPSETGLGSSSDAGPPSVGSGVPATSTSGSLPAGGSGAGGSSGWMGSRGRGRKDREESTQSPTVEEMAGGGAAS